MEPAAAEPVPLATDADGVIRVAGTRVTLETVIDVYSTGATPEEISQDFPVLRLDDVYAVITYYLRHREEVEAYVEQRRALAAEVRREIEAHLPQTGPRERLLEEAARAEHKSLAELREQIAEEWLERSLDRGETAAERSRRLRDAALKFVGSIEGQDPDRAANTSSRVRARLAQRYAR